MTLNILLIDQSIRDYNVFVTSVNSSTLPIVYSSTTSRADILSQLSHLTTIDRIGIAFSNEGAPLFLENELFFGEPLTPFSNNMNFILQLIQQWNVKNIDYLACNTLNSPGWMEYYANLKEHTGVIVGASNDYTGNIQYGGDWILESTGQDIELIYFTQSIEYYKYLLGGSENDFNIVIKQNNTLHGTGYNKYGTLGLGYNNIVNSLTLFPNITLTPLSIACGDQHTVILMNDASGSIYVTGYNQYGQLGLGNTTSQTSFTLMPNSTGKIPKAIACGSYHTIVLMNDASGTIYVTGFNQSGQLGLGNTTSVNTLTLMTNSTGKVPYAIACGPNYTVVLTNDASGSIYGTGENTEGQLAQGDLTQRTSLVSMNNTGRIPLSIFCGPSSVLVLMNDASGSIYCAGNNSVGQFGLGNYITPRKTFVLMTNSTGKKPTAVSAGQTHTIVLMNDGTIYGTGDNTYGQLGTGNTTQVNTLTIMTPTDKTPSNITCSYHDTFVLMMDGSIYVTGKYSNDIGILTRNLYLIQNLTGKTPNISYPIVTSKNGNISGAYGPDPDVGFLILMTDNTIYGMGYIGPYAVANRLGLGYGYEIMMNTYNNINVYNKTPYYVSCGNNHVVVMMNDGTIYGTGYNAYGQLGIGTAINQTSLSLMTNLTGKTPKSISCGFNYTVVLMNDASGTIYGTGQNQYGQLGTGNTTNQSSLTLMTNSTGKIPKAITCGSYHTVVLMNDASGTIYVTGYNNRGQFGNGTYTSQSSLTLMTNSTGKIPMSVACGSYYTVVLMNDASGTIYVTGYNQWGELGTGNTTSQISLTLMPNSTGKIPKAVSCGTTHTLVLMNDASGTIYVAGQNIYGQLGTGNYISPLSLTLMTNSTGKIPISITCGKIHTNVLMSDGTLYSTGGNVHGQLGIGNNTNKNVLQLNSLTSVNNLSDSIVYINDIPLITSSSNVVCFKEGSLILTDKGYIPIQDLRQGDLVRTLLHGFVPIDMIGKRDIYHVASKDRNKNQLYICTNEAYPEVFEPLVITGCHSILIDEFIDGQRELVNAFSGGIYITDNQYRLPACVDPRAKVYDKQGTYTIYHIALENNDYYLNYGIYANGLLVETCSRRYLKELSNMEII